jgi:hypothetical protein
MIWIILLVSASSVLSLAQKDKKPFKVIAFFTAQHDLAHINFVHEAIPWFKAMGLRHDFVLDTTSHWENMEDEFLKRYQVIIFLDTRPEQTSQRSAFQKYMEHGGAWMGFHFAGFALSPSAYNQDWDWYHDRFLGSGQYKSNTWRPTSAYLLNEENHLPFSHKFKKSFMWLLANGTVGKTTLGKTLILRSCYPFILKVFLWVQALNLMRSGMKVTTLLPGPIKSTR